MGQDIKRFVVAICDHHGEIFGTGFVIAPNVVVTCAHVVSACDIDPGGSIHVKFPDGTSLYEAQVVADSYDFNNDVAILQSDTQLTSVQPAVLGRWQEAKHTDFFSYGYRPLDAYRGNPAEGRLLRESSDIQPLAGESAPTHPVLHLSSQQVSPGMSGSPVYIPATDRVVGMITAIWNNDGRDRDTAFAISAEAIVAAWSEVSLYSREETAMPPEFETEAATFHVLTPSWIESYSDSGLLPLPHSDDAIATILKGFSPFPNPRAEADRSFLFGSTGGFWSGHGLYAQVAASTTPQVILAEAGAGKTAMAYALRQVGTPEGNPIPKTLPVVLPDFMRLTPAYAKSCISEALLALLRHNPTLPVHLPVDEKTFLLEYLVHQFGQAEVIRRLQEAGRHDRSLPEIINRFNQIRQPASNRWLRATQQLLNILGFRQLVLAIDANRRPVSEISGWLKRMGTWGNFSINPVLYLPIDRQLELDPWLMRADVRVLTWTERQLRAMATWRFDRLVHQIGVHISLEELFEGERLTDFVRLSNRNPRRMARLWGLLMRQHADTRSASRMFSWDDLAWAVEQVDL